MKLTVSTKKSRGEYVKSATRKIGDAPSVCRHPEHNPPMHRVFEPGFYEHACPGCGAKSNFAVPSASL